MAPRRFRLLWRWKSRYARGYRSSAINGGAGCIQELNVANPEFLDAWELGIKSEWMDRRLQLNASTFHYNFKDQQLRDAAGTTSAWPGSNNPLATLLLNVAASRIQGLELEVVALLPSDIAIRAGLGLLDSKYSKLSQTDSGGVVRDLAGNELIEAPPYTADLALDHSRVAGPGEIVLHADISWTGRRFFTPFNELPPNEINVSEAQWELNARIGYRSRNGRYDVGVWGKNLNNNDAVTWSVTPQVFGIRFATIPYPRRYGVDFRWDL